MTCKYKTPCPTRATVKEIGRLEALSSAFCDIEDGCESCPTYQFLKEDGTEFKRVVGYLRPVSKKQ
jgi:hypothetical protein